MCIMFMCCLYCIYCFLSSFQIFLFLFYFYFVFFSFSNFSCTVQNSVLCERVVVENMCKLNDCNIGAGYKVVAGSKVKGEAFSLSSH